MTFFVGDSYNTNLQARETIKRRKSKTGKILEYVDSNYTDIR